MRLNPAAFNRLLTGLGQHTAWRRGYACPCVDPRSGQPVHTCAVCSGKGRLWDDATDSGLVGVCGRDLQQKWMQSGAYSAGDVMLSIPSSSPLYAIGPYDRVMLLDRSEPFSDAILAGVNTRLRSPVLSIDRVLWKDSGGALVEGAIPRIVNGGYGLEWDEGKGPPLRATYTITGRRGQEFYCYQDQPFDRPLHGGAKLPRRIVLRRFDLFGTG